MSAGQDANADDLREPRTPMHAEGMPKWEEPKTPGMLLPKKTESSVACDLSLLKIAYDLKLKS